MQPRNTRHLTSAMSPWRAPFTTRRDFLKSATIAIGGSALGYGQSALAAEPRPLLADVDAACRRLAPLGWRQVLLEATGGEFDLAAADLRGELAKPLAQIDRSYPGFGDFDRNGTKAITRGEPGRSLLYHAFASPTVVANRGGAPLGGFPTLAEIEAVENYVYGAEPPTLADLQGRANGRKLGIVVYALQYRNTPDSVHGRHAELCFARAGIARLGTLGPLYDAERRTFAVLDEARPFDFRVVPRRFAAYVAVEMAGSDASFGPQDALPGDKDLVFWVPLHKLFSGPECIAGLDLQLELVCGLRNEEIAQFHRFLDLKGLQNNWSGEDLENFPFTIKDELIGALSQRHEFGFGMLEPRPSPLVMPAQYEGRPLTFPVDGRYTSVPGNLFFSSMQLLPEVEGDAEPGYLQDAAQLAQRPGPQYIHVRHRLLGNGQIDNLNHRPDMMEVVRAGGYEALHYMDAAGDGWIEAHCPELDDAITNRLPAYCMVGLPDFFPQVKQRDLMQWWKESVPKEVRAALWALPPFALSQTRIAANITLPVAFSLEDTTVTAIVSQPGGEPGPVQTPNGPVVADKTGLPDGSPGLFDPGWDTSQGIYFSDPTLPLQRFLAGHGLGCPFVEDAKLCAALGNYWPGVAPDATRQYAPGKMDAGELYPYPSITPLTDEEIGMVPAAGGVFMPWDGVRGPQMRTVGGKPVVAYADILRVDYIDLVGMMTAALTARIDTAEYQARTLAMEAVYWGLGIHDPDFFRDYDEKDAVPKILRAKAAWAVFSFRTVGADDPDVKAAEQATGVRLAGPQRYRFHVYRWGDESPDPEDMGTVLVEMLEQAIACVSGNTVLLQREGGPWTADTSMPT